MNEIKIKTWVMWAVILFAVGLAADYFFWHLVLGQRSLEPQTQSEGATPATTAAPTVSETVKGVDNSFITSPTNEAAAPAARPSENNFLESLKLCAPEIAAQTIATPEALVEYLRKTVGIQKEDIAVENYHLTLTSDGSARRVHIIMADNTNGTQTKEIRYFKLDQEGFPERVPTEANATLEKLLAEGAVTRHEVRSQLALKDGSSVDLETHDKNVFELQYNNHGKVLSCRFSSCQCPK